MAEQDENFDDFFTNDEVEEIESSIAPVNADSEDFSGLFEGASEDSTGIVPETLEIPVEQKQTNDRVEQSIKNETGIDLPVPEGESFKSPLFDAVELPHTQRQEPLEKMVQARDEAVLGAEFQIDRLMRMQGFNDEQIQEVIALNRKELLTTTGQGGSRLLTNYGTEQVFQAHLNAVKLQALESESSFDSALNFFKNEIDQEQMMKFADLRARGLVDLSEEAKIREAELVKEGLSEQEAEDKVIAEFDAAGIDPVVVNRSDYQKELRDLGVLQVDDADIHAVNTAFGTGAGVLGVAKGLKEGAAIGSRAGPVGAVVGGLFLGAAYGGGMFSLGHVLSSSGLEGRFTYDPELDAERNKLDVDVPLFRIRRTVNHQIGIAQGVVDNLTTPEAWGSILTVASPATKIELVTRMLSLADEYGVSEKLRDSESVKKLIDVYDTREEEEAPSLADQGREMGITSTVGILYHPYVRTLMRDAITNSGFTEKEADLADFFVDSAEFASRITALDVFPEINPLSGLVFPRFDDEGKAKANLWQVMADIANEIAGTDKYREDKAAERNLRLKNLAIKEKKKSSELRRSQRRNELEQKTLEYYENVRRGFIKTSDFNYKFRLQDFVDSHTWNNANPKWRGDQPDADRFSDFVKAHLLAGGRRDYGDPEMDAAIAAVINKEPKENLQSILNNMSLKSLREIGGKNIKGVWKNPSTKDIDNFFKGMEKELTGPRRGRAATREQLKALELATLTRRGTFYEPSFFNKLLGYISVPITYGAETPFAVEFPDSVKPIIQELGLPTIIGTPAGVDYMAGDGIRPVNSTINERVLARRRSLTGGFQLGYEEIMLARGYERDDAKFIIASNVGMVLDMLNFERYGLKGISNTGRMAGNLPSAKRALFQKTKVDDETSFKTGTPSSRVIQARNELLKNTSFDRTTDPVVSNHQAIKVGAQQDLENGVNPIRHLSPDEQDLFNDVLTGAARSPDDIRAALALAAGDADTIANLSKSIIERLGPNELQVLRNHPDYKRLRDDIFNYVRAGKIEADDAQRFMAHIEDQAIKIADLPDNPYRSAAEVLANLEAVINKPAGAGARFMGKGLEEVDTATTQPFSQPLRRDISLERTRAILDDLDIDENDSKFVESLNEKFNVKSLDELSDTDIVALKEEVYRGKMATTAPVKAKPISNAKVQTLRERYKSGSFEKAPGALTRTTKRTAKYKEEPLRQKTTTDIAAEDFRRADSHTNLIGDENPIIQNKNWNSWWGGITNAKERLLEPPLKVREYADPKKMASELERLTPEQKRRADSGIQLVEQLGTLYETGRAQANLTAQLLGWTILSRSLSAFPHESAFLDAFMSAPPSSIFKSNFGDFINRALDGTFDQKALLEYDVWVGGIHRRRAADKLLADGEIDQKTYNLYVGRDKKVVDSLVKRGVIEKDDVGMFFVDPLPNIKKNRVANGKVATAMSNARKLAESLRRQDLISIDEFRALVGFHPALRIEGMGNPAAANLRAFGKNFLLQSSDRLPADKPLVGMAGRTFDFGGQTKLEAWHNILLDMSISGQEARRLYHQIYQGAGIDNKVISFMLLAAGRKDVIVIDRIQANHFWGAAENLLGRKVLRKDGSKIDLYEGFSAPDFKDFSSNSVQSWAKNPRPFSTTRGLADVLNGARGSILYEAIENLLSRSLPEAYRLVGREGEGSLGRFHWETWVINSGQEVGHDTLNVVLKQAQGFDRPAEGAFVSEGKFQMRRYGMQYAVLPDNQQAMVVSTQDGTPYIFVPESWAKVVKKLTGDGANVNPAGGTPRIVPKGWKLENEKFANTPWYHRASVNRDALDIAIRDNGRRATTDEIVALERFAGRAGSGRVKGPRVREAGIDEATFRESTDYAAFEKAKNENSRPENLAPKTMEEYEGSRVFMIDTEDAGFLVKNGDLQNVFNNSGIKGLGTESLKLAIEQYGARTLDCFDGFLPLYYSKAGFVEVARVPFVDDFAPPAWNYFKLGRPDIVIMAYQGGNPDLIRSNFGRFREYTRTNNRTTDFDAAQELARRSVRDSGDPRGVEAVGAEQPRRGVGEQPLRGRVGEDKTPDSVEPTVIRLIDPTSDTKYQRKKGVPLGYFEYDQRTRIAIINLFERGDLDTLWHENGHFMAALMGENYKNTIFKSFDHIIDDTGTRKLTDLGHEQFAEAWRYYRRVRDYPNGYLRRLFDELWIALHNFWSKLRRKSGLLPNEVREYWDLEFGVLPSDRRFVKTSVSGAMYKKKSKSMTKQFDPDDLIDDSAVSRAQLRVAKDLGYDEPTIRSLLGDRPTSTIRSQPDFQVDPGQQPRLQRVVERTYEPRSYDAVDAGLEVIALIKNSRFRKELSGKKLSTVGTGRYQVPTTILNRLNENVNIRMVQAIGAPVAQFAKKLMVPDKSGINAIGRRATVPDGVTNADIAALQRRLKLEDPELDPQENRSSISFFVLSDREEAGFKTLLHDIAKQPEGDMIPFSLFDPSANLRLLSINEYNMIQEVLTDIVATPLQRRNKNQVHPGYINAFASIFDSRATEAVGDMLKDIGRFFGKKPQLDPKDLDPKFVDILEGFGRRAIGAGEDLARYANSKKFGVEDDLYNFFGDVVDNAAPRVSIANLTNLQRLHKRLNGAVENMTQDAAERLKSDNTTGTNRPVTYDPIVSGGGKLTIETLAKDAPIIQDLLDGPFGMTPAEREAIVALRSVDMQLKRGRKPSDFSPEERTVFGSAIEVLKLGIDEKYRYVTFQAEKIYERVMAVENVSMFDYRERYAFDIYNNFYTGNFVELFKMAGNIKNVRATPQAKTARRTYNLGFLNRFIELNLPSLNKLTRARQKRMKKEGLSDRIVGGTLPEYEQSVISLMILTKMDELKQDLAKELTRYGYVANRRKIVSDLGLLSDVSVSTERYLDRVQFYVNRMLQYGDITKIPVDELGKRAGEITYAKTAKEFSDLYGPAENPKTFRGDADVINRLDLTAIHEADQIIARLGIKPGRGSLETVEIGGQTFFMPKVAVDFLEDHIQQTFPRSRLKKTWGVKGKVIHRLTGRTPEQTLSKKVVDMAAQSASSIAKVGEFLVSPRFFYSGLLIGTGGLPMVGYGMGVFIGGLSQMHLGKGVADTVKAAVGAPGALTEALPVFRDLSEAIRGEVGFSAAVLARIHGRGSAKPFARPIVTADGRIFTADMVAETVRKYGWKSAFVDVIKNPDTYEAMYNRFSKTNPTLANAIMFGAGGAPYGVTSTILSAALGASVGQALKPGNIFNKAHRAYAEAFAAIDSYLRIRVLVGELNDGKALEDAAPTVRDIMLDYSAMSDSERAMISRYFAFWSYFAQANKLFFRTAIENPDRIITQLKFALASQRKVTEGKDPDKFINKWDQYRSSIPIEIGGHIFRLPFLITGDSLGMLTELATVSSVVANPFGVTDEARKKAALAITGRLSPQIGLAIASVLQVDPGLGFPLDRATLQVPARLIELDALLFGGALWDYLEIKYIPPDKIKMVYDDPETGKKRINPNNIESPGQGIWVSQSPVKYYYLMNYLQTPLTGRMGDNMWALDRANLGIIEKAADGLEYIKNAYSPDKPLMSNFGVLHALSGVVGYDLADEDRRPKGPDDVLMPGEYPYLPPSAVTDPDQELVTAPLELLKQAAIAYEGKDGTVTVYADRFFWPELGRAVGLSRMPNMDEERPMVMEMRRHATRLKQKALEQKGTTREAQEEPAVELEQDN